MKEWCIPKCSFVFSFFSFLLTLLPGLESTSSRGFKSPVWKEVRDVLATPQHKGAGHSAYGQALCPTYALAYPRTQDSHSSVPSLLTEERFSTLPQGKLWRAVSLLAD